jgi:hypothetical protein
VTPVAAALDTVVAIAVAFAAAAWLVRRAVRFFRVSKVGGACGCESPGPCGRGGPTAGDLREAASRAASRVNRDRPVPR